MISVSTNTTTTRGRPRDAVAHQRILKEAFLLAQENGYRSVSIKEVAQRSKVSRQTIYRRWPTKQVLLLEVVREQLLHSVVGTPSQASDLESYLCHLFEVGREKTGDIIMGILMASEQDSWLFSDIQELIIARRLLLEQVLEQDAHIHHYSYRVPISVVAETLAASMWYRVLFKVGPLDNSFAHTLAVTVAALRIHTGESLWVKQ